MPQHCGPPWSQADGFGNAKRRRPDDGSPGRNFSSVTIIGVSSKRLAAPLERLSKLRQGRH